MTLRKALKLSLFLPILLPVVTAPLAYFGRSVLPEILNSFFTLILASGVLGGLPYLFVIYRLFRSERNLSTYEFRKKILRSPFLMVTLHIAILLAIILFLTVFETVGQWEIWAPAMLLILPTCDLLFGYAYILLAFGAIHILQNGGYIDEELDDEFSLDRPLRLN
jgi:hypothetical protein